ncbi:hypothetical protein [Litorivicinus lipolyticus]|uniref:hypothetical protein n=1 Tax=Litorivicinus lipolyticus TaxID=418701 RepID=UPI003B5989CD
MRLLVTAILVGILARAGMTSASTDEPERWMARFGHAVPTIPRLGVQTSNAMNLTGIGDLSYVVGDNFGGTGGASQARYWAGISRLFTIAETPSTLALQATQAAKGDAKTLTGQITHGPISLSFLRYTALSNNRLGLVSSITDSDIEDLTITMRWPLQTTGLAMSVGLEALSGTTEIRSSMLGTALPTSLTQSRIRTLNAAISGWTPATAIGLPGAIAFNTSALLAHQAYPLVAHDAKAGSASKFEAGASWIAPWNLSSPAQPITTIAVHGQKQLGGQLDVLLRMPLTGFNGVGAYEFGELVATDGALIRLDQALELPNNQRISVFSNHARGRDRSSTPWINIRDVGVGYSRLPSKGVFVRARASWPLNGQRLALPGSPVFSDGRDGMRAWVQAGILF